MNKVVLIGRLTKDPEVRSTQSGLAVGRYTLAVDRPFKRDGEPTADFISCVAFGKQAEFLQKYCRKGLKLGVTGRIQTGSYTKQDCTKVYTTDVIVDSQEFVESKKAAQQAEERSGQADEGGFEIPDLDGEDLPFN